MRLASRSLATPAMKAYCKKSKVASKNTNVNKFKVLRIQNILFFYAEKNGYGTSFGCEK